MKEGESFNDYMERSRSSECSGQVETLVCAHFKQIPQLMNRHIKVKIRSKLENHKEQIDAKCTSGLGKQHAEKLLTLKNVHSERVVPLLKYHMEKVLHSDKNMSRFLKDR